MVVVVEELRYNPRTHAIGESPVTTINEPPTICVVINEKWVPYITGAMEVLLQPEYWPEQSSFSDIIEITRLLHQLNSPPNNCEAPGYNWLWQVDVLEEDNSGTSYMSPMIVPHSGGLVSPYNVGHIVDFTQTSSHAAFIGTENGSSTRVGGPIHSLTIAAIDTVVGNVISVTITDCLDNTYNEQSASGSYFKEHFDAKRIVVDALSSVHIFIVVEADYTCGVA